MSEEQIESVAFRNAGLDRECRASRDSPRSRKHYRTLRDRERIFARNQTARLSYCSHS